MMVRVNGNQRELPAGTTVADLVGELVSEALLAGGEGIAVALDGEVSPRGAWERTFLHPGSTVEILTAVPGG